MNKLWINSLVLRLSPFQLWLYILGGFNVFLFWVMYINLDPKVLVAAYEF